MVPEQTTPRDEARSGTLSILVVDEQHAATVDLLRQAFGEVQFRFASDEASLTALLADSPPDLVITECDLGWADTVSVLKAVQEQAPEVPVILFTAALDREVCDTAIKAGLFDFVEKQEGQSQRLAIAVRNALNHVRLTRELAQRDEENRRQREELEYLHEALEEQIDERTREAERRAQQLRLLAAELTKAEERERRRLAQMLHDDLQQMLVAARMHISAISPEIAPSRMVELMRHVDDLLDRSIRLSRNLTHRASPPVLYDAGLAPALEWLGRQVQEEHGLEVEVDCDDTAQPESQDTRILLYQACRELLFNVVKHSGTKRCKLAMHHAGEGDVQVSVCDEGKGFDPEASRDVGKGDGFGLFSIRERLELIRGRMEIESVPGEGTCVRLYAPVRMSDEERIGPAAMHRTLVEALEQRPAATAAPFYGTPVRVLLADDHRIMRASLAGLLRNQAGIEVVGQAGDGQEVIEKAHALRPDVIVMDVTMPIIDGVEATRRLTAEMPGLAVIALSMHEKEDMQRAMREAGAIRYLTKDGPPEMLVAAIRSSAAKKRASAAAQT
jgi:signal transduction histidine kinase